MVYRCPIAARSGHAVRIYSTSAPSDNTNGPLI
jgi:hypothetical protein